MRKTIFVILFLVFFIIGCSSGIRFFVCPNQYIDEMKTVKDIGQRREILVGLDLRVVIVHFNERNEIVPVEHFRPEHTFTNRIHPLEVTYKKPMMLTTLIIIKKLQRPIGVAIKDIGDSKWRIYWLQDADIKDLRKEGMVYLPPYEDLPLLEN
jgi:hypothetical protein